jgi:hypothetical protein
LAFHASAQGKSGRMPELSVNRNRSFREASPTRRQDVANEHQRKDENLGFSCFRPKESRAGCPSFP